MLTLVLILAFVAVSFKEIYFADGLGLFVDLACLE